MTVGALVNGLAAYAFVTIGSRALGAAAFAPVSVVWSLWAATVAFLTFPLQHLTIRSLVRDPSGEDLRGLVPAFLRLSLFVAVIVALASAVGAELLFSSVDPRYPVALGLSTLGSGLMGVVRGTYGGRERFAMAAAAMAGENLVRVAAAVIVVVAGLGAGYLALALATGPLAIAGGASWLWSQWRGAPREADGKSSTSSTVGRFADVVSVGGGTLMSQVVLSGPPVLLAALDADPVTVTSTFAAITAFRAPYLLGLGAGLRATGWFSALAASEGVRVLRTWVIRVLVGGLGLGALGGGIAIPLGLPILRLLFGDTVHLDPFQLGLVAAGCLWALASLGAVLIAVAMHRPHVVLTGWITATVVGAAVILLLRSSPDTGVILGFALAELAALVFVAVALLRKTQS